MNLALISLLSTDSLSWSGSLQESGLDFVFVFIVEIIYIY